jgi:hypothetical protein
VLFCRSRRPDKADGQGRAQQKPQRHAGELDVILLEVGIYLKMKPDHPTSYGPLPTAHVFFGLEFEISALKSCYIFDTRYIISSGMKLNMISGKIL